MIQFDDVTIGYNNITGSIKIIEKLNFIVNKNDFLFVCGRNGSGKTTLIKSVLGLLPLLKGNICMDKNIHFGYITQNLYNMFFFESIEEEINEYYKIKHIEIDFKAVQYWFKFFGLDYKSIKDSNPFNLSDGQRKRIAIILILLSNPDILIFDEPFSGLDKQGRIEVKKLLIKLHNNNSIILISHYLENLYDYINKFLILNRTHFTLISNNADKNDVESMLSENGVYM